MKRMTIKGTFILFFLLSANCLLAQDLWNGTTIASSFHGGSGTAVDPYQIRTGAELMYFEQQINAGNNFSGKTIRLMNDVDLGDKALRISQPFAGSFDGNGHFIEQIFNGYAIFQNVSGTIYHLGVRAGVYRDDRYPYYGKIYLAELLEAGGLIENCYHELSKQFYSSVTPYLIGYSPFLVGSNYGTIRNCYATGNYHIYDSGGVWGGYLVGMLVGTNYETGIVENCAANTYNNGLNDRGQKQPLITTNNGTLIEGNNTTLDYFTVPDPCTIEFIDLYFSNIIAPKTVALGQSVGSLPVPTGDCSFIGWKRDGEFVSETDIVNANWTLFAQWEQRIRRQPTASNMSVEVDDAAYASYQWYVMCGEVEQLGQWQSTNHGDGSSSSMTFTFDAQAGQQLLFDYTVSSEEDYDKFTASLNGTNIVTASGYRTASFSYAIPADGTYNLVLRYSKDDSTDSGSDMVTVTNIRVSAPVHQLDCTQDKLPALLIDKKGQYYCVVTYSNTGITLTSDIVDIVEISPDTDISQLDNAIYVESQEVLVGQQYKLPILLKNVLTPVGCSFKLTLPDGFSLVKDYEGDVIYEFSDRTRKMSVVMHDWNDGSYDFALTPATSSATITGTEGVIITLHVKVSESAMVGNTIITLSNCLIQNVVSGMTQDYAVPDVKTTFTIVDYTLGDVNGDGNVTPADAIMILYHYFNVQQEGFIAAAADVNDDGNISPADAIEALYQYFGVRNGNSIKAVLEDMLDPQ